MPQQRREALVTRSGGHSSFLVSHCGPFHHNRLSVTCPPRLPRSAGFSCVGTWRQVIAGWACIFLTRFITNCLYSPPPLIQWSATVLSSHPKDCFTGNPSSAQRTLLIRFVTIWADTSSKRGIVSPVWLVVLSLQPNLCSHLISASPLHVRSWTRHLRLHHQRREARFPLSLLAEVSRLLVLSPLVVALSL